LGLILKERKEGKGRGLGGIGGEEFFPIIGGSTLGTYYWVSLLGGIWDGPFLRNFTSGIITPFKIWTETGLF